MPEPIAISVHVSHSLRGSAAVVPADLCQPLALAAGSRVLVRAGGRQAAARLRLMPAYEGGRRLVLSPAVARRLGLPLPSYLHLRITAAPATGGVAAVLDIGPLVGILGRPAAGGTYGEQDRLFRRFIRIARKHHVEAFVFSQQDIAWPRRVIRGRVPAGGGWARRTYPFPHVVYDRAVGRWRAERKGPLLRRLQEHGIVTFNGVVGHKWSIHRHLAQVPALRPHIPETRLLSSPEVALDLLARHGGVYLKPSIGSVGHGIFRVRRMGERSYAVATSRGTRRRVVSQGALRAFLAGLQRRTAYIVQQELELVRIGGGICDVRALLIRDAAGIWRVAGMAVRLGRPGGIVSNLHRGGRPAPLSWALRQIAGDRPVHVRHLITQVHILALRAAQALQVFVPHAGDLGVDLGIDRQLRMWLIEVNPKPGRESFMRVGGRRTRFLAHALPFQYARYLAGFGALDEPLPAPAADTWRQAADPTGR